MSHFVRCKHGLPNSDAVAIVPRAFAFPFFSLKGSRKVAKHCPPIAYPSVINTTFLDFCYALGMNTPAKTCLAAIAALALTASTAAAGPFTNLVVFGDSLSDVGNIAQATANSFFVSPTPGPYYHQGRFSNGPNYADGLAAGLGFSTFTNSTAGGNDFAYGGAQTTGTSFPYSLYISDVDDQVSAYRSSRTANATTLYLIFAGSNDLINGQTNMSIPVNSLKASINSLITAGARQFLVFNLPLLGNTPRYNGSTTTHDQYNARSEQYNTALATMLDTVQAANPTANIFRLDVAGFFSQLIANPALFGVTNVTDSAAPGLKPDDTSYNTSLIVPNPNEYVFWDDLHPTKTVHAILAQRALDLFRQPGDYYQDNSIDAADYITWRNGLGTVYSPYDYELWRSHFGGAIGPTGSSDNLITSGATYAVPEPQALALLLFVLTIFVRRYRR